MNSHSFQFNPNLYSNLYIEDDDSNSDVECYSLTMADDRWNEERRFELY